MVIQEVHKKVLTNFVHVSCLFFLFFSYFPVPISCPISSFRSYYDVIFCYGNCKTSYILQMRPVLTSQQVTVRKAGSTTVLNASFNSSRTSSSNSSTCNTRTGYMITVVLLEPALLTILAKPAVRKQF